MKVYDSQTFVAEDDEESFSESFMVTEDLLDDETIEILATEHQDDDAALVMQFEEAITESIQGDADLAAYFSTYQEARRRLSEKVRTRGFWPMSKGYGKKGGKGAKGKGKMSLAQRIANTLSTLREERALACRVPLGDRSIRIPSYIFYWDFRDGNNILCHCR